MRHCLRAALVLIVLLASVCPADAATVVQLPLGKHFTDVAVAPSGQAWVAAAAGRRGSWAEVGVAGRPRWHRSRARGEFLGLLSARPGGGAWMLRDRHTVVRIDGRD